MPAHKTAEAQITTDHDQIRKWAEARGGKPAAIKATHRGKDPGIIRLIFPSAPNADDESIEEISWDEFFRKFAARVVQPRDFLPQSAFSNRGGRFRLCWVADLNDCAKARIFRCLARARQTSTVRHRRILHAFGQFAARTNCFRLRSACHSSALQMGIVAADPSAFGVRLEARIYVLSSHSRPVLCAGTKPRASAYGRRQSL